MYGGKVAEYGPIDAVYNHPQHPYTQRLLEAFPDLNRPNDSLASIPGSPPRLNALPPGCRFEPRCHKRIADCTRINPKLVKITPTADYLAVSPRQVSIGGGDSFSISTAHYAACLLLKDQEMKVSPSGVVK
jgi:oligopeptide/dipeptide ABC transporter ATP-binding protein